MVTAVLEVILGILAAIDRRAFELGHRVAGWPE